MLRSAVAAAVLGAGAANWVVPAGVKIWHRRAFLRRCASSTKVHLTFDDGPDPNSTPQILDALRSAEATATFFVVGERAEAHPGLVRRMSDEGHSLGSHGYAHTHAWKSTPWSTATDLRRGREALADALGTAPGQRLLFRPPFGKLNFGSLRSLSPATAWWNVDPQDYECESGDVVVGRLADQLYPGTVVLLHDGRLGTGASSQVTVDAVQRLLVEGRDRGLEFAAL